MEIVKTQSLTKTYGSGDTAVTALDAVNVSITQGEFVAVMGPSGCGKSTLLNLIGGLDRPTGGSVIVDGDDLSTLDDDALTALRRQRIGFIFQFYNLIPVLTARENAALPLVLDGMKPSEAEARAADWLKKLDMGDRLDHRPDQLSGGQRQRVAIARALVNDPALVLADEPTGNLDSRAADEFATSIRRIADEFGRTILLVTHDPRISSYADRIIFLKDGHIVDETALRNGETVAMVEEVANVHA